MLDGLALAYAEAQEEPYRTGVAGSCNTLHQSASAECRRTLGSTNCIGLRQATSQPK